MEMHQVFQIGVTILSIVHSIRKWSRTNSEKLSPIDSLIKSQLAKFKARLLRSVYKILIFGVDFN